MFVCLWWFRVVISSGKLLLTDALSKWMEATGWWTVSSIAKILFWKACWVICSLVFRVYGVAFRFSDAAGRLRLRLE
jgi:hypothetical protein